MWAYADQGSYKMALRKVYKNWDKVKDTAVKLQVRLEENFNKNWLYDNFLENLGARRVEKTDFVFVSDFFKDQYVGGAELSLDVIIDSCSGTKSCYNPQDVNLSLLEINKDSTWVFGNIANLSEDILHVMMDNNIKYYFVEFDYKYCEYRNPLLYEFLEDEKCEYKTTEKGKLYTAFINKSIKTFFMSEAQKQVFVNDLDLNQDKLHVLSSLFADDFFEKIESLKDTPKNDTWIVLGSRSWVKGAQQSESWCKDNNLNYEVVNGLPYDQMLEKLASAKGVCFKPTGLDTCPRLVIEAKLLGCELELNENVQHLSEPWFNTEDRDATISYLKDRHTAFWDIIDAEQ